jgi:hypothetical protein
VSEASLGRIKVIPFLRESVSLWGYAMQTCIPKGPWTQIATDFMERCGEDDDPTRV